MCGITDNTEACGGYEVIVTIKYFFSERTLFTIEVFWCNDSAFLNVTY